MSAARSKSPLGSEFDSFLFTPLGEDQNGLPLSVVSLLARMNLDPWQEAKDLADLPAEAAARRLACSLDSMTDPVLRRASTAGLVSRLLALLPKQRPPGSATPAMGTGVAAPPSRGAHIGTIVMITSAILILGSQLLAGRKDPTQPAVVHGPAALTIPSQPAANPDKKD